MGAAIGGALPIALGVLLSPMPIVAVVLLLLSGRATANGLAFLLGWVVGIYALGTIVLLVAGAGPSGGEKPAWAAWLRIALGVLLLVVAARQWSGRPREGVPASTPRWMSAIDRLRPVTAFGLAALLGAVNPKNLLLVVSGAVTIATAAPGERGIQLVALGVFTVVAAVGVAAPFLVYVAMGARAAAPLERLKEWLVANNTVIVAVLLLIIGVKLIGEGLAIL